MPEVAGRLRAAGSALIAAVLLVGLFGPAPARAGDPPNIDRFLAALGAVESNGRYEAVNATSSAIGKYQILPANWRVWASRYLGDADASPTPVNQETIARRKVASLYGWLGAWAPVAHWWLTGNGDPNPDNWSDFSRQYVNRILALIGEPLLPAPPRGLGATAGLAVEGKAYDDASGAIAFSDGWGEAGFSRYNGGLVRYATDAGETASFTFTGTGIAMVGPLGPTRGEARIYIDGTLAGTVSSYASHFRPRVLIFNETFDRGGTHTIKVEVAGTPDHAMVAIDEFIVVGEPDPISVPASASSPL